MNDTWNKVDTVAGYLDEKLGPPADVLVVLGSGLGGVGAGLEDERSVETRDVPHWPQSTVAGHTGLLRRGIIGKTEVLLQQGRIHLYEGYRPEDVALPVRAAIQWGVGTVVLTNAAGGIKDTYKAGTLMMIEDHINLTGKNPLTGPNDDARGPRFPDMTRVYDPILVARAIESAIEMDIDLKTGIYAGMNGPSYETPAEINMLRRFGADAVGMSTVLEAIAAAHMGAKVAGLSCITNMAAKAGGPKLTHEEVQAFSAKASDEITRLVVALLDQL